MGEDIMEMIARAAIDAGIDPAFALAVAQRESSFRPDARSSKTIRGLFQMMGTHRQRYGIGDSTDPTEQTRGWSGFIKDVKGEMGKVLGRSPDDAESYLGHHFGGTRAARMMQMDPSTPVDAVFTAREMAANPHFARAGTVGALNSSVLGDIRKRSAAFSSFRGEPRASRAPVESATVDPDTGRELLKMGRQASAGTMAPAADAQAAVRSGGDGTASGAQSDDLSSFGSPAGPVRTASVPAPSAVANQTDLSQFGVAT